MLMQRYILLIFLCISASVIAQTYLPVVRGGVWRIVSEQGQLELNPTVDYLGNFDSRGLAVFRENNKYGIVRCDGKIVLRDKTDIEQLSHGYYRVVDTNRQYVRLFAQNNSEEIKCLGSKSIKGDWYLLLCENSGLLFHSGIGTRLDYDFSEDTFEEAFGYLKLRLCGVAALYDPDGTYLNPEKANFTYNDAYAWLSYPDKIKLILPHRDFDLPVDATNLQIVEDRIRFELHGSTKIIDAIEGSLILELPYTDVRENSNGNYSVNSPSGQGVVDKTGKVLVPAIYDQVDDCGLYFRVRVKDKLGLVSQDGSKRTGLKYGNITYAPEFITVRNENGFYGVLATKTYREIIEPAFTKIIIQGNKIKGILGKSMKIYYLTPEYTINKVITLSNTLHVTNRYNSYRQSGADDRLLSIGWFYDTIPVRDINLRTIGYKKIWGLKDYNDSILIKPRFNEPVFVNNSSYSLIPGSTGTRVQYDRKINDKSYAIIDHNRGVLMASGVFFINEDDLRGNRYLRCYSSEDPLVISQDRTVKSYTFVDHTNDRYVRYCNAKKHVESNFSEPETVFVPGHPYDGILCGVGKMTCNQGFVYRFPGASWNFLDDSGKALFKENFLFAHRFYRGTAIVKGRNGKWGLINKDSLVVPTEYDELKRLAHYSDTVILVKKYMSGFEYLDTNCMQFDDPVRRVADWKGSRVLIHSDKGAILRDLSGRVIKSGFRYARLLEYDYFVLREKGEFHLYDQKGVEMGILEQKPERVLSNEKIVVKKGSRLGLVDSHGEEVLVANHRKIEEIGKIIYCVSDKHRVYDESMNLLLESKNPVLFDSITGWFAELKGSVAKVYDYSGSKIGSVKFPGDLGKSITDFYGGRFFSLSIRPFICNIDGSEVVFPFEPRTVIFLSGGYFALEDANRREHLFDSELNEIMSEMEMRRIKQVDDTTFSASVKNDLLLFTKYRNRIFDEATAIGTYNSGLLLLRNGNSFFYIDSHFERVHHRSYRKAEPFIAGMAAVSDSRGWMVINRHGARKGQPDHSAMTQVAPGIFQCPKQAVYGLYSDKGLCILPARYHKIAFVNENVIQAWHYRDMYYFDRNGNPLFEDQLTQR